MAEANINDDVHEPTDVPNDHFKEQLLENYLDLLFDDDVSELSCKRCGRVLIYNYVANCGHLFCSNCKRVLSNGEGWRCPDCREYVIQFGGQNVEVEERVFGIMVHCLNHKYGCKQTMPLRQITTHLEVCEDTKEANLPMYYTGRNSMEAVMKLMTDMSQELKQLKETMDQLQKQTQNHFKILEEANNKQRTDNEFKWVEFGSTINGLRSDWQVDTARVETLIEDKYNTFNKEINAKLSEIEKIANLINNQEQLQESQAVIENHIQHQPRDSEQMEILEQKVDKLSNLFSCLEESLKQMPEQFNQKFEKMEEQFNQKFEKMEEQFNQKIKQMEEESIQKLKQIEEQSIQKFKQMEDQFNQKFKQIEEQFNQKIKQMEEQFNQKSKQMDEQFNQKFKQMEEQFNPKLKKMEEQFNQKFKQMEEQCNQTFKKMEEQFNQKFKKMEEQCNQKFKLMEERFSQKFKQMEEQYYQKFKQMEEQFNQKFKKMDDKHEITKSELKNSNATISKIEDTAKHNTKELKEQQLSCKVQTERKIKKVAYQQQQYAERMSQTLDRQKKDIAKIRSQMLTEEQCKQKMREMEDKATRLNQQQDEIRHTRIETVDQVEELIVKEQSWTEDSGLTHDNFSQLTVLENQEKISQGLDNSASDFEIPVEKRKHEENIQQNIDQNGDLMQFQRPSTNKFGEGTSHTATTNKGSNIRKTKSISNPESLNKQPKTKGNTNANQRPIEITEWEEAFSYTYNEFIKRPTKYKVPEYNMLLMAESAAEITKFINCFEVLMKYTKLDDALNSYYPLKSLISTPFEIDGTEIATARVEGIADLKKKQCYEYLFQDYLVRFIDSAGDGTNTFDYGLSVKSAKGLKDSNEQMTECDSNILYDTRHFIEKLRSLHSIVIVMKSTEIKLSSSFLDSLKGYLANFNKSRVSNLLFVITDFELATQLERHKVDKVAHAVEKILQHIAPTSVARATHNINFFFIYNDGLRCMVAHNSGEQLSDSQIDSGRTEWQMAFKQCQSLVTRVQQLHPWREEFLSSIFKKKSVQKLWK